MLKTFAPLSRQFSAIEGLQKAYTLVYSLDTDGQNCRLTLCRTGANARMDSLTIPAAPEFCYLLLQYLYENVVQPEIWRDVISEVCPLTDKNQGKDGVTCVK